MNKNLAIFLGILLVSACVYAQVEDDDVPTQAETADVQVEHEAADQ